MSFGVGSLVIALAALATGELGGLAAVDDVPVHDLVGGAIGATYAVVALFAVGSIGAGGVAAGIIPASWSARWRSMRPGPSVSTPSR